jgi:phosphotransferase system enzyme I (PtsI)
MLSGSRLLRGAEKRITQDRQNAERAVQQEIHNIAAVFEAMDDAYLAERLDDIRQVGNRLVRNLTRTPYKAFATVPDGGIVIAEELSPADTALLDPRRTGGFATVLGGKEGHTAIMARALGLPAVVGVAALLGKVRGGDPIIVDGDAGRVILNPTPATRERYMRRRQRLQAERRRLARLHAVPAVSRDGVEVTLQANMELPRELEAAQAAGAQGIGLLRTEFLYMNRDDLPGEDEQYRALRDLVRGMRGNPVTVRTFDVGGEKMAYTLGGHIADSVNPALGLRAVRLSLRMPELLETQLAAILRAGAHGPVRVLLPMVDNPGEIRQVRDVMRKVATRLKRRSVAIADPLPPLGAMIEIPGAALSADALALQADFFALGTNDLTMYTLAIDRADEQVAYLYDPLHPAVLRLIQFSVQAAHRANIPVSVCGEIAGDPRYTALLLGLGVLELSMAPGNLPRVKQRVRALDLDAARRRADNVMDQWDAARIAALVDDFNDAV